MFPAAAPIEVAESIAVIIAIPVTMLKYGTISILVMGAIRDTPPK